MDHRAVNLFQTLEKIVLIYRNLCELLREESRHMVSVDTKALAEVTLSKETILLSLWNLEQERIKSAVELAASLGLGAENASLVDIAALLDASTCARFKAANEALKMLLNEARELNSENMRLASDSLDRIDVLKRNILGAANSSKEGYNAHGGRQTATSQGGRLLSQEA